MNKQAFIEAILAYFGLTTQLLEAVSANDSYEGLRSRLSDALNGWVDRPAGELNVLYTFSDRVIVYSWIETERDYKRNVWEIPYRLDGDQVIFGAPVEVKQVMMFEPKAESITGKSERFAETIKQPLTLLESVDDTRRVRATGITADVVNGNQRRYPRAVLAEAVQRLNSKLNESAGQGRLIATGEAEHPSQKTGRPNLTETVVKWEAASLDAAGKVLLEGAILPTAKGKDISVLVEHGVPVGVSMRGYGSSVMVEETKQSIQQVTQLTITGFDLVAEPSDPNGWITESATDAKADEITESGEGEEAMKLDDILKALRENPELLEGITKQLGLAEQKVIAEALGVSDIKDAKAALEEGKKAQAALAQRQLEESIAAAIAEATKELPYGDLNPSFVEAVRNAAPATVDAVKPLVEAKRKEWDGIFAANKLGAMGKKGSKAPIIEHVGDAFEEGTGWPAYAKASWELAESIRRGTGRMAPNLTKPKTVNEVFAQRYLEKFDKVYGRMLKEEAQLFTEAEATSDLNLPYSVSRAIVAEAFPSLVATGIFDVDTTDQAPTRVYYEATTGESGYSGTVTDEDVTADTGAWVAMANNRLTPGTVVVTNSAGSTTYTEGTDYVIDYEVGNIMALAAGSISDSQALKVDYGYTAIRKGENVAIERAKTSLTYVTLEIEADRLATEITREAVVFSRSQLGWDATSRTLANLTREIRRKIDQGLIYKALAAALQVASNSGGTWTAASDPVTELVEKIGVAGVKVANRYYDPTFILASRTNGDKISNWDGFTNAGMRADSDLMANGYVGRLKGIPTFESTEMSDAYIVVGNREVVAHRIFNPLQLRGPYPSYSSNKLVAADQYYAEEFNGSIVPIAQKASYVKIA